jgi:HD superfamily phosphohydrolase
MTNIGTTNSKIIGCKIHGYIRVTELALKIINTPEFQRLRDIKQLGLCHLIYPAATHTRFEHSIGVYYLTGKMAKILQKKYPDKTYNMAGLGLTKLTDFIIELIKIAGLCHDIGHGPFSHIFDDILLEKDIINRQNNPNIYHEVRSCLITEEICKRKLSDILNDSHIKFIKSIINPEPTDTGAIYQIVSNYLNGIDVDKFDYLARDPYTLGLKRGFDSRKIINEIIVDQHDNIAYAKHCSIEIYDMFQTRYMMHKQVYNHKGTKIIESMVYDLLMKVDPVFEIFSSINSMEKFCTFTDNTVFHMINTIINPPIPHITINLSADMFQMISDSNTIYQNILQRNLYKCVADITDKPIKYIHDFFDYLQNQNISTDNLQVITTSIGFVSGNKKNPFDSTYFYNKKDLSSKILDKKQISTIMCDTYTETRHLIICKKIELYSDLLFLYEEFVKDNKQVEPDRHYIPPGTPLQVEPDR